MPSRAKAFRPSGSAPPPSDRPRPQLTLRPVTRVSRYLRAALDALPPQYAERLDNVAFVLRRAPLPHERRRAGRLGRLYGLYEGIPLTHRTGGYGNVTPDRITVFWGPLVRDFPEESELEDQVRKTVYHEIAHYFGLEEEDLRHSDVR